MRAAEVRGTLAVGAILKGRVTALKDYGAFVDLGGVEGMLHVSQLGFQRVAHPKDLLAVGQEIEVQILKMEKSDDPKKPERISLSLKSLEKEFRGATWRRASTRGRGRTAWCAGWRPLAPSSSWRRGSRGSCT